MAGQAAKLKSTSNSICVRMETERLSSEGHKVSAAAVMRRMVVVMRRMVVAKDDGGEDAEDDALR